MKLPILILLTALALARTREFNPRAWYDMYERVEPLNSSVISIYRQFLPEIVSKMAEKERSVEPWPVPAEASRYRILAGGERGWEFRFWASEFPFPKEEADSKIGDLYMKAFSYDSSQTLYEVEVLVGEQ